MQTITLVFLFLAFFIPTHTPPWNSFSMEALALIGGFLFILTKISNFRKIYPSKETKFIFLVFGISCLTYFYPENIWLEKKSIFFAYFSFALIIYLMFINDKNKETTKNNVSFVIIAACLTTVAVQIYQMHYADNISSIWISGYDSAHGRPYGNFNQPNNASTFLLIGISCIAYLYKQETKNSLRVFYILITLILSLGLSLASSKTAFLALIGLLILGLIIKNFKASLVFFIASVSSIIISATDLKPPRNFTSHGYTTLRAELWEDISKSIIKNPFNGQGINNTIVAFFDFSESSILKWDQPIANAHNIFLEILTWFGVPIGLTVSTLLLLFFSLFLFRNSKNPFFFTTIPIAVHSLSEFPYIYANFLLLQFGLIGLTSETLQKSFPIKKTLLITLFIISSLLLLSISLEYLNLREKYTDLRFYENKFQKSKKPDEINHLLLDLTTQQYNFFLKKKISSQNVNELEEVTRHSPTKKNFYLLLNYYKQENNEEKFKYWKIKALAIVPQKENQWFNEINFQKK